MDEAIAVIYKKIFSLGPRVKPLRNEYGNFGGVE
jgi:hypothetical protein